MLIQNCYLYRKILHDNLTRLCVTFDRQVTESLKPKEDMIAQLHWYRVFELGLLGVRSGLLGAPWVLALGVFLLWEEDHSIYSTWGRWKKNTGTSCLNVFEKQKTQVLVGVCPPFFGCVCVCRVYDLAKLSCRKAWYLQDTKKRLTLSTKMWSAMWFFL